MAQFTISRRHDNRCTIPPDEQHTIEAHTPDHAASLYVQRHFGRRLAVRVTGDPGKSGWFGVYRRVAGDDTSAITDDGPRFHVC